MTAEAAMAAETPKGTQARGPSAVRMLPPPEPVGRIGQFTPPGAGGTPLRSGSYFDGARALTPAITSAARAGLGLVYVLLGGLRKKRGGADEGAKESKSLDPGPA